MTNPSAQTMLADGINGCMRAMACAENIRALATPEDASTAAGEATIERIAQWLHDETNHPDSYPDRTWPETDRDDGQRDGGFVKIVPAHAQAYFRDIARRLLTQIAAPPAAQTNGKSTDGK